MNRSYSSWPIRSCAVRTFSSCSFSVRRDVALGVLERLLARVVRRDARGVGVGDLDVIAEHLVVADLQTGDAGPQDLVGLEASDPVLAAGGDLVQFVEVGVVSPADDAALARAHRRIVDQGRLERFAQIGAQLEPGLQVAQQRRLPARQPILQARQERQRLAHRQPGLSARPGRCSTRAVRRCRSNARRESLAQIAAQGMFVEQFSDGFEPGLDGGAVGQRREQPVHAADGRPSALPCGRSRASSEPCRLLVAQGSRQFQAAAGHLIEEEIFIVRIRP